MIRRPELLTETHSVVDFLSSEASLDLWLKRRTRANQGAGATKTYVITDGGRVIGYYALAAGAVAASLATGKVRRNMPDPIPVMILCRLAVDMAWQGQGLGLDLLREATLRTLHVAHLVGVRALLVHALHEKAACFYEHAGFAASPVNPLVLMLLLDDVRATLSPDKPHL